MLAYSVTILTSVKWKAENTHKEMEYPKCIWLFMDGGERQWSSIIDRTADIATQDSLQLPKYLLLLRQKKTVKDTQEFREYNRQCSVWGNQLRKA